MLDNLKLLLGITDGLQDEKLTWILDTVKSRLKNMLGGVEPPESMSHIIVEVSVIRFNKIGSEGLSSHTVAGETLTFVDDDFSGYMSEINAWLDSQQTDTGKVRFL